MSRGINQKFKLYYLKDIMLRKTDETHALTMPQILDELEKLGIKDGDTVRIYGFAFDYYK